MEVSKAIEIIECMLQEMQGMDILYDDEKEAFNVLINTASKWDVYQKMKGINN